MRTRLQALLRNPVTWKSPLYLLAKFPLGIATFVILSILVPLTLALLSMPLTFRFLPDLHVGALAGPGLPAWHINSTSDSLLAALVGLMLWPMTLHVTNGLAWLHAKFARVMLSVDPLARYAVPAEA